MDLEENSFRDKIHDMEIQDFEPLPRERSNTWHGDFIYMGNRPSTFSLIPEKVTSSGRSVLIKLDSDLKSEGDEIMQETLPLEPGSTKKNSMRRNAWGNASYAELIAQAIESSSEKRLTLTQIYEWMIKNIPYFQLRSDGPSSMGWKNSIRHNLSLHNQFSRVQNEGTGKSSWWVVNRNFIKSKIPRRRATMGDPAIMDRKRCRVNKKLKSQETEATPIQDDNLRKFRTISEANETNSDNDLKSTSTLKKSSSQTVIPSSFDEFGEKRKNIDNIVSPDTAEHVLKWSNMGNNSNKQMISNDISHVSCSNASLQASHLGLSVNHANKSHNSIILKVQASNEQKTYFEAGKLSSPILVYVASTEKTEFTSAEQKNSLTMQQKDQNFITGSVISDLDKQTNQMSLGDNEPNMNLPIFHISEKRRKMLMALLHSERFCQLRRQNPELNRKIIDMLQRKKNMLLKTGNPKINKIKWPCSEQSSSDSDHNLVQMSQSLLGSNQTDWLKLKLNPSVEPQSHVFPSTAKHEAFEDSFEFTQSHSFQIDVDQTIGDMDFDGNIDDLFGSNSLLLNCEDELSILSHDFS